MAIHGGNVSHQPTYFRLQFLKWSISKSLGDTRERIGYKKKSSFNVILGKVHMFPFIAYNDIKTNIQCFLPEKI